MQLRKLSLFSLGDGLYGGTGHGNTDFYSYPAPVAAFETLPRHSRNLRSIAAGWAHSAAVSPEGGVFVWGQPFELRSVLRLRRTASTSGRGLARFLTSINEWLSPPSGQGASGNSSGEAESVLGKTPTPKKMEGLPPGEVAVQVSCGAGLTAVRCESGALFLFGLNSFGQCGVGEESNTEWGPSRALGGLDPVPFSALPRVPLDGDLAANKKKRRVAGEQRRVSAQTLPPLSAGQAVADVSLGFQHGACVTQSGAVLAWGKGERGQLGSGLQENTPSPTRISFQSLVPENKGKETGGGAGNEDGSLDVHEERGADGGFVEVVGREVHPGQFTPPPSSPRAVSVKCGFNHTACLTACGAVFVWGKMQSDVPKGGKARGAGGLVAALVSDASVSTYEDQLSPRKLDLPCKAVGIACSAFHTAIQLEDGTVMAQGMRIGSRKMEPQPVPLEIPVALSKTNGAGQDGETGEEEADSFYEFGEVSAVLRRKKPTRLVVGVRGGPAANSTVVLDSSGQARSVFFGDTHGLPKASLAGVLLPTGGGDSSDGGGEAEGGEAGVFAWPELAPADKEGGSGPAGVVTDAALGWQHCLLLVK